MNYYILSILIYIFVGILYGIFLNYLILNEYGKDEEFDNIMLDSKVKYISILILSILWIIALPTMILINLFNKEEV